MPPEAMLVMLMVLGFFGLLLYGAVCGIMAKTRVNGLAAELKSLRQRLDRAEPAPQAARASAPPPIPVQVPVAAPPLPAEGVARAPEVAEEPAEAIVEKPEESQPAPRPVRVETEKPFGPFEPIEFPEITEALTMKAALWLGMFMFIIGSALFLRYAYSNNWIGYQGRLMIGMLLGVASIGAGEHFRRRAWKVFPQVFAGGGFAILYICDYVAFEVYHLIDAGPAMALAILINAAAVLMAVAENTVSLALLAVLGGFLSPMLLSTGENRPHSLFLYVAVLDLAALGAAYFRRWPYFDTLCFVGTFLLYAGWYHDYYTVAQMGIALGYATLFYLLFLLIPLAHSLLRRSPADENGLALLVVNAVVSFACYYTLLFPDYRQQLGFVVLGQAALLLGMFQVWVRKVEDTRGAQFLLSIALALITLAVPVQLRSYGIPLAWAAEGVLLTYLGLRFADWPAAGLVSRVAGLGALVLSAGGLLAQLPLHTLEFWPVANGPFLSWVSVIAAYGGVAWLSRRPLFVETGGGPERPWWDIEWEKLRPVIVAGLALTALAGSCVLFSMETWLFWDMRLLARNTGEVASDLRNYQIVSLLVLWAVLCAGVTRVLCHPRCRALLPPQSHAVAFACFAVAALIMMGSADRYLNPDAVFLFHSGFLARLAMIGVFWWGAKQIRDHAENVEEIRMGAYALELTGHAMLTVLLAGEMMSISGPDNAITPRMAQGMVSALWAAQAFGMIWAGLVTQEKVRRYAGLGLFGLTVGKVMLVDTSSLETVYRIVAWLGTGAALLAASYFYHAYAHGAAGTPARTEEVKEENES